MRKKSTLTVNKCYNRNSIDCVTQAINTLNMKRIYLSVLLAAGMVALASNNLSAQQVSATSTSMLGKGNLVPDTVDNFISFSPVYMEGKTYVRWLVKNDRKDGVFIIERSPDGAEFEAMGFRDRVGTQLSVNLFYSYIDEEPLPGVNHYRILQVGADNTYKYSPVVRVKTNIPQRQAGSVASEQTESESK